MIQQDTDRFVITPEGLYHEIVVAGYSCNVHITGVLGLTDRFSDRPLLLLTNLD